MLKLCFDSFQYSFCAWFRVTAGISCSGNGKVQTEEEDLGWRWCIKTDEVMDEVVVMVEVMH
jgi:hypothetical protein